MSKAALVTVSAVLLGGAALVGTTKVIESRTLGCSPLTETLAAGGARDMEGVRWTMDPDYAGGIFIATDFERLHRHAVDMNYFIFLEPEEVAKSEREETPWGVGKTHWEFRWCAPAGADTNRRRYGDRVSRMFMPLATKIYMIWLASAKETHRAFSRAQTYGFYELLYGLRDDFIRAHPPLPVRSGSPETRAFTIDDYNSTIPFLDAQGQPVLSMLTGKPRMVSPFKDRFYSGLRPQQWRILESRRHQRLARSWCYWLPFYLHFQQQASGNDQRINLPDSHEEVLLGLECDDCLEGLERLRERFRYEDAVERSSAAWEKEAERRRHQGEPEYRLGEGEYCLPSS